MSGNIDFGTRNSNVATAKLVTEKTEREVSDVTFFKDVTGRGWMKFVLDNDFVFSLPCDEMVGVAWYDQLDVFHKENAKSVYSIEFRDDRGLQQIVPKDDVIGFLDGVGPGKKQLTINMDNGFSRRGAFTYDVNKYARRKLNAVIWAISPALGLVSKDIIDGAYLRKAVVDEDGIEMSPAAIAEKFSALKVQGIRPKMICSLMVDEKGIRSVVDIERV